MRCVLVALIATLIVSGASLADENASQLVEVKLDPPTVHSIGIQAIVKGDANRNAVISVEYRKGSPTADAAPDLRREPWRTALPLFRPTLEALVRPPDNGWTPFAGSIMNLEPETQYQVRVKLADPDGGSAEQELWCRTRGEPRAAAPLRTLYVVPGDGGGKGTESEPFKGLKEADAAAQPGDLILLAGGTYAPLTVTKSGTEPDRRGSGGPIIWRSKPGEEAVIDGMPKDGRRPARGISVTDVHDVWFENLTVRNVEWGIVAHGSSRIVVRRCHVYNVDYGFTCTRPEPVAREFFISDNVVEGPCTWPRTKGIEDPRGFQISGTGHVICYNRVRGFADGIDTFGRDETRATDVCRAIDIYSNEISEMTDDGIETDYSQQNVRCFSNRLTNCFQGISEQPVFGGPVYIFRNAMYNIQAEPFKMHTAGQALTSGFFVFHNTCVKQGIPWMVWTQDRVNNVVTRNNLFIGTARTSEGQATPYAMEFTPPMESCDFDYDGFGGGPFVKFAKWLGVIYPTLGDVRSKAPVERHAVEVDAATAFASGVRAPDDYRTRYAIEKNDLRPAEASRAVDAGEVIPTINDGFRGKAPDIGAYEAGEPLPHYGPRPEARP